MSIISAKNLSKSFRQFEKESGVLGSFKQLFNRKYRLFHAINNIDLEIEEGKIVGLLGPNGAGKTTLMKCFTGIIIPSSGNLSINGFIPSQRHLQFRKELSLVMGQKSQLWWDIPALDSLELIQQYYEISDHVFKARLTHLCDALGTTHLLKTQLRKMSLGERMKMELIACLLHNPKLIFLDEPTIGLDIVSQYKIRDFLKEYHRQYNPTIIISSHYMQDIESLCDHIILLMNGAKVFDGSKKVFKKQFSDQKSFIITYHKKPTKDAFQLLEPHHYEWNPKTLTLTVSVPEKEFNLKLSQLTQHPYLESISTTKQDLEHIFTRYITDKHD